MSLEIIHFLVNQFSLEPTDDETESEKDFDMSVNSAIDFNQQNGTDFRIRMSLVLHQNCKFKFQATQTAIVRGEKVSIEEMKSAAKKIPVQQILYPYLRAFTLSTLKTAGYNDVMLPVLLTEKED
ncbi:protein-export chaperone SecB [Tatumella sp. UCD-D_suzukii]|uniref:protein-export chaperone SecB n=1 Tax=Tatumella sp. UCD-D_suzukii TaxID=1408192 RepID=UPI00056FC9EA|nr:protein-export chaperone SecB [Tatumella sp. UCD-D_suzukii]